MSIVLWLKSLFKNVFSGYTGQMSVTKAGLSDISCLCMFGILCTTLRLLILLKQCVPAKQQRWFSFFSFKCLPLLSLITLLKSIHVFIFPKLWETVHVMPLHRGGNKSVLPNKQNNFEIVLPLKYSKMCHQSLSERLFSQSYHLEFQLIGLKIG